MIGETMILLDFLPMRSGPAVLFLFGVLLWIAGGVWLSAAYAEQGSASKQVREPVLAGSWYPGSPEELRGMITGFLKRVPEQAIQGRLLGLVVPHAGYVYSGQTAAYGYQLLTERAFSTVIVIAPSHRARFSGVAVYDLGGFRTPLGLIDLDEELIEALKKTDGGIRSLPQMHAQEHALEIQLPFLQVVNPGFKLVPLIMGQQDLSSCRKLADAIAECCKNRPSVLVVASSDLSHFHSGKEARRLDQVVIERVKSYDPEGLSSSLDKGQCEACGGGPMVAAMLAAKGMGATRSRILYYTHSGEVTGDDTRVVGYLSAALLSDDPEAESAGNPERRVGVDLGLDARDRAELRAIAMRSLEAKLLGRKPPECRDASPALREHRGAFVTLKKRGDLRGCIGRLTADAPLCEVVSEMAQAAAFHDRRFRPLTAEELKDLTIEISVLTPFRKITDVNEIQIGVHGILVKRHAQSGLLLPQVAVEQGWDRTTFLEHTCMKAGLPGNAWKDPDTEIYIFSADVF